MTIAWLNLLFRTTTHKNVTPSDRRPRRVQLAVQELESRLQPSAISDAAYPLLNERVTANQQSFFVYKDGDSGFNHGFPSGFFASTEALRNQIQLDAATVNDNAGPSGFTTDPNALDRERGTVLRIVLPALTGSQFAGVHIEEPEHFAAGTAVPGSRGYNLTGTQRVLFEARSPSLGGMDVQFGVGGLNTDRTQPYHLTSTFAPFVVDLNDLRNPDTNFQQNLNFADVHFVFTILTSALYEQEGGTILIDNIRFDPVPANPLPKPEGGPPRLSFPLGNTTFGVVPAVLHVSDNGEASFTATPNWVHETNQASSYLNDRHTLAVAAAAGAGTASWTLAGLQPRVYEVQATWAAEAGQATNASFTLFDNATMLGNAHVVDQTKSPKGLTFDGKVWQTLGLARIETGTLKVELTNPAANGMVAADAIRIVPTIPPDQAIVNLTTTYESALTVFALLQRGTPGDLASARLIADTFLYALRHDNTGGVGDLPVAADGSHGLRDSYSSGDLDLLNSQGPGADAAQRGEVRLAGFSTDPRLAKFALVLDGAFGGNNAFAIMALLAAHRRFGDVKYLDGAREISRWIFDKLRDPNGPAFNSNPATQTYGGYFLGYDDQGVPKTDVMKGKSIENNADIFAAFTQLAQAERERGDFAAADLWTTRANVAGDYVMALYEPGSGANPRDGHFHAGTLPDGPDGPATGPGLEPDLSSNRGGEFINKAALLDSNTFTTLPLAASERYRNIIDWREPMRFVLDNFAQSITVTQGGSPVGFQGFNISKTPTTSEFRPGEPLAGLANGITWEFTAQTIVTMRFVDQLYGSSEFAGPSAFYLDQIRKAQLTAPYGDGRGLAASTADGEKDVGGFPPLDQGVGTPFQFIPERVGLAATIWAIFADQNQNIFIARSELQFSVADYRVVEGNVFVVVTVTRTGGSFGAASVVVSTAGGNAKAGADYRFASALLTWPDGDTSPRTFVVRIKSDTRFENDETIGLVLTNISGDAVLGKQGTAKITILDNDPPRRRVSFKLAASFGSEAVGLAQIAVRLSSSSTRKVTVNYVVVGGTAQPADYVLLGTGTLTFKPGRTTQKINVAIINDGKVEPAETIQIMLINPVGAKLGVKHLHTLSIV